MVNLYHGYLITMIATVVKYDFTADLTGIGDRSVHDISIL